MTTRNVHQTTGQRKQMRANSTESQQIDLMVPFEEHLSLQLPQVNNEQKKKVASSYWSTHLHHSWHANWNCVKLTYFVCVYQPHQCIGTLSRDLHTSDGETHWSALIHLNKITNTAEHNDEGNLSIHQNEEECNFFAHQAPVTLWMGALYYSWHFSEHRRITISALNFPVWNVCKVSSPLYMNTWRHNPQATLKYLSIIR